MRAQRWLQVVTLGTGGKENGGVGEDAVALFFYHRDPAHGEFTFTNAQCNCGIGLIRRGWEIRHW